MRVPSRRLLILFVVIAGVAFAVWRMTRPHPLSVLVAKAEIGRVEETVANTRGGTVKACQRARLAPPAGGQVVQLLVKKGQRVRAGEPLLSLWDEDLQARVRLARSEAQAAEARAEEACLRAEVAERDQERLRRLVPEGAVSEEALDQAVTSAKAGRAACSAAKATAEVSRNQVELARTTAERMILRAPFSGVVAEITGEPGEYVTPSPPGIPTPPAIDLIDNSCMYVTAPIDEVDAPAVKLGMPARITLDAFGERHFTGRVRRIAPYVLDLEKQARTVEVEAVFSNPKEIEMLLPGYTADVEVIIDARDGVLRIPTEAVLEGKRVLLFNPSTGILEDRAVETGLSNWRYTEVRSGLAAGDLVVTSADREGVKPGVHAVIEEAGRK